MIDAALVLILVLVITAGLLAIPLGLPGLWVIVAGFLAYGAVIGIDRLGLIPIIVLVALALAGEVIEWWIGFAFTKRYGGSTRSGWGAVVGGLVGAVIGVPVPIVGSVIGAFVGAFAGAAIFEYSIAAKATTSARAGLGAVLGRAAASAIKVGLALVICVVGLYSLFT